MALLLSVDSPDLLIRISGPTTSSGVLLAQPSWPIPYVKVRPEGAATLNVSFPLLFEETDYELLVQSRKPGAQVEVSHRDMRTLSGLRQIPDSEPSTVLGVLRFRQSVGLTTFEFAVDDVRIDLTFEVFPAKLDYLDDYELMVAGVQEIDRTVPLRFFDETYRKADVSNAQSSPLDWLSILRSQGQGLTQALRYADAHPILANEPEELLVRPGRARTCTNAIRRDISLGRGSGGWANSPDGLRIRERIRVETTRDSLDSVEHRWLSRNLRDVARRVTKLEQRLRADEATRASRFRDSAQAAQSRHSAIAQQAREVDAIAKSIASLANLSIVRDVPGGPIPPSFSSLRLLRTPGYADAYRILMALRLGLTQIDGGDAADLSLARLGALYEAWCFVEVLSQVEDLTGAPITGSLGDFAGQGTLGARLIKGVAVNVRFALPDGRTLTVRYNRSYRALTGVHAPDIELAFEKADWPELVVLLDAKYRLDSSKEQVDFFGLPSPPQDAIGALHRYRDAIVVDRGQGLMRPVVIGAALYPLSVTQSEGWADSKLSEALGLYGIGAIPLLPNNTKCFRDWLSGVLALPHDELAASRPPGPIANSSEGRMESIENTSSHP